MSQNGLVVRTWEVPSRMTWAEWTSRMRDAAIEVRERAWYLGDLLNYGIEHWPAECWQFISNIKLAHETLMNYKSVAGRILQDERNAEVPFTIYQDICSLPRPERDRIVTGYLGGTMNRAEIRAFKNGAGSTMPNGVPMATDGVYASGNGIPSEREKLAIEWARAVEVCIKLMKYGDDDNLKEALDELIEKAMVLRGML